MTAWLAAHTVAFDALLGKLNFVARASRERWPAQARQPLMVGEYGRETLERAQACGLVKWSTETEVEFASREGVLAIRGFRLYDDSTTHLLGA